MSSFTVYVYHKQHEFLRVRNIWCQNSYSIHAYIAKHKGKNKDNLTVKAKLVRETTLGTNHGQASQ